MTRFPIALVLLLAGSLPACAVRKDEPSGPEAEGRAVLAAPSVSMDSFRVATLNAAFLFDGLEPEGGADFPHKDDPAAARAHLDRIGEVIRALDADLVLLQEVENERVLEMLIQGPLAGLGYSPHFVEGKDSATGQDVALLSRVPVSATGRTDDRAPLEDGSDDSGVSKNLYARLEFGGLPITVIGLHLLAQPENSRRKPQREAQAEVIRRLAASEAAGGRAVIVLGDFNDYDGEVPDVERNRPITDVLARIKSAGPGEADDLQNAASRLPQAERYTHAYDRNDDGRMQPSERSSLDHILLSPTLFERLSDVDILHDFDPARYTDHFPVVVTLDLN